MTRRAARSRARAAGAGRSTPSAVPGGTSSGIRARGQREALEEVVVPAAVVRTSRSCVVEAFVYSPDERPAQRVVAQVGDHQQAARARGQALADVGVELEERVELQELDAGAREDLLARHARAAPRSMTPSVRWSR